MLRTLPVTAAVIDAAVIAGAPGVAALLRDGNDRDPFGAAVDEPECLDDAGPGHARPARSEPRSAVARPTDR
jgi:hypothetical protein